MNEKLQRLRRDLTEAVAEPNWPPGYGVRTFTAKDAPTVYHLLAVGYAQGGGHVGAFEEWWPSLRDDKEFAADLCFLAVDERQNIVGVAQCWTSAFVKDLVVHPLARRRGIAEALLRIVFLEFRHRGEKHVDLKVQVDNPTGAVRLYKKLRMREVSLDRSNSAAIEVGQRYPRSELGKHSATFERQVPAGDLRTSSQRPDQPVIETPGAEESGLHEHLPALFRD
jgi:ribosomal protein S18 acetylase RimI-like enzyme